MLERVEKEGGKRKERHGKRKSVNVYKHVITHINKQFSHITEHVSRCLAPYVQ